MMRLSRPRVSSAIIGNVLIITHLSFMMKTLHDGLTQRIRMNLFAEGFVKVFIAWKCDAFAFQII